MRSSLVKFAAVPSKKGISFETADLMIAATALVHDLTLVTHNVKDYQNIPDLQIVDWLAK